ncbi:glycerol-3-phosphate 1-O-acyltransferase PlsY [Aquicella lusitana]|uniref:Glycerol-3-phosphate acyltransferase n=2 Tax=Aquicella lusitana TaxID=254246 RepID=A0A370GCU7_9COXI|nr:glycerol-3-phosphate 1-O-acyltransferase PlsY [Aquicella lusitana]RDI41517.1 acyl-phosphate glycerol-3-phosphate acyltransferase [Aquicella lusitana]VVC72589.1 putative glycerol-3-phosphate acyltransferase [Aquicella lusitana]
MLAVEIMIAIGVAYLFGSISSAIIVCKLMRLPDPRTQGSRNPGATNVLRIGGKKAAIITLFGDMLKGVIPVLAAKALALPPLGLALVAFAAFVGHLFPIFFRFEGGKGVATLLGSLLALSLPLGFSWIATWLIVAFLFRYSSLASLVASLLAPLYAWFFMPSLIFPAIIALMSLMLVYRHRSNIANLFAGKESKIGQRHTV